MNARRCRIVVWSLRFVWRFPFRSILLILSAAIGVIGVVCSVNYGASGTKQLMDQIRQMGTNVLVITPTQSRAVGGRSRTGQLVTTLVEHDYLSIEREIPSRTRSSAWVAASLRTKAGDLSKSATIIGCEPDYFFIKNWKVVAGDLLDATQERTSARVALLGNSVARDLFGSQPPVGQRLMVNRVPFTVIGVLSERGQGLDVANEDAQVYVPLTTAMHRLINVDHYDGVVIEIDSLGEMDKAAQKIRSKLRQLHHLPEGQSDDFQVQNQKSLLDAETAAASRLNFFLQWIGGSALAVSSLGMLGISWIAVKARTREIGTRRALGATSADIFLQVASEGVAMALIGCSSGFVLSWPLSRALSYWNGQSLVFVQGSAVASVVVAASLNIAFALLPSRQAALLEPTNALKYE